MTDQTMQSSPIAWKRAGRIGAAALAVVIGVGGFLQTRWGHPLLMGVAHSIGCPVELDPQKLEDARLSAVHASRGAEPSPAQPALVFSLDAIGANGVLAWAMKNHVDCDQQREGTLLLCNDVPSEVVGEAGAPRVEQLALEFTPDRSRLVNVTALRTGLSPQDGSSAFLTATTKLEKLLGPPGKAAGDGSVALLSSPAGVSGISYRFHDYQAEITALNVSSHGVVVREHFVSARD